MPSPWQPSPAWPLDPPINLEPLRPRGICGYADLLLARANGGPGDLAALADLLGYRHTGGIDRAQIQDHGDPAAQVLSGTPAAEAPAAAPANPPFWRAEYRRYLTPPASVIVPDPTAETARGGASPLPLENFPPRRTQAPPLARWSQLLPPLRAGCADRAEGNQPDIPAALRLLERGALLDRMPRRRHRRWGERVQIVLDRSERLSPFFDDQDEIEARITRLFPRSDVERARYIGAMDRFCQIDRHGDIVDYRLPDPGTLVIVLGDLGCLARHPSSASMSRWIAFGRHLAQAGCRPTALTPCSSAYWHPALARVWTLVGWDRTGPRQRLTDEQRDARAIDLLRWASPALRLEPGLLREIRLLLGRAADAGTEADAWQDGAMSSRWHEAATFAARAAQDLRAEFAAPVVAATAAGLDEAQRKQIAVRHLAVVQDLLLRWHGEGMDPLVWFIELLNLPPELRELLPDAIRVGHVTAAERALEALAPNLAALRDGPRWYRAAYERRLPHYDQTLDPALKAAKQQLYVSAYDALQERPPPPPDFEPWRDPAPPGAIERAVDLRQVGGDFAADEIDGDAREGSLLATIRTVNGELPILGAFWTTGIPPTWAHDWGTDARGPWVIFRLASANQDPVEQRMRWCPPGGFLMGSPPDEDRYAAEGPQHRVTIAHGFWMFDTACTETLWTAVMNSPVQRAKGENFPVTNVSWADARAFINKLNALLPGLALTLPSETQWEYACRAGTSTLYSFGDTIERAEVNFGNDDGPVPVGSLPYNDWGLHEMHGNVWEWCEDAWHGSYIGIPPDSSAWSEKGAALRVIRGGCWLVDARFVRSAYRSHSDAANRVVTLGFRCARVQPTGGAEQGVVRAEPASRPSAERGRPWGPTSDAPLLRVGEAVEVPAPRRGTLLIRSDREELMFRAFEKPAWASAVGRDRFGLFAEFTVPDTEVGQRMRWIPPGRFWMGSPADEPGRYEEEGPKHLVTLTEGFWLFDTPCRQALWASVMQTNPSRFQAPGRPVETVSFADAQEFIDRLNGRVADLQLALPSEAQWEYSCRAGSETETYAGPMTILGQNNAPMLDAMAWYGGNSGCKFDLDKGDDSSEWTEKQYDHSLAGTRLVGEKAPNSWGLYDMLGNVWEWCSDHWHDRYEGAPSDGSPWIEAEGGAADRVVRGGSWNDGPRFVRAAYRLHDAPAIREDYLGFRCVRVQPNSRAKGWKELGSARRKEATTKPQRLRRLIDRRLHGRQHT